MSFCSSSFRRWNSLTRYNLNSTEIHDANSNAMSETAYVPPYRPAQAFRPIAFVDSIHFVGERVKAFRPASLLNPSNSRGLKHGLYKPSHIPKNSIVFLFPHPIGNNAIWIFGIFLPSYIRDANIINTILPKSPYFGIFHQYVI